MTDSVWVDLPAARADLRRFLSDGPTDRPVKLKLLIGSADGINNVFETWDDRLVDGTFAASINGAPLAPTGFTVTDLLMGVITFTTPPPAQSAVRGSYYFQYFLDAELDESLQMAAEQITENNDILTVITGLKSAALNFAAHFGFQKQAIRWAARKSSQFLLQEEPVDADVEKRSTLFMQLATSFYTQAEKMRDSYYMRHGRRHAPSMGVFKPRVPYWAPRR